MKIKYYPAQPHCFAFGGFDIQMLKAMDAANKHNVKAEKLDIWDRDSNFEILHIWGVGPHNYNIIKWAQNSGKKIIATVLLPYYETLRNRLGYFGRYYSQYSKEIRHFYQILDAVIVVNELQAIILKKYYKVNSSKIHIIPNIVDNAFFENPNLSFSEKYLIKDYLLCVGNVCQRKNQLNLVKACIELNLNLVLIGKVLDGEGEYGQVVKNIIEKRKNILWVDELPYGSDDIVAAYNECTGFVLISHSETQPISVLEACAKNKPLVMLDKPYAHQKYYNNTFLCKSDDLNEIKFTLQKMVNSSITGAINPIINDCREELVGLKYSQIYKGLINKNSF